MKKMPQFDRYEQSQYYSDMSDPTCKYKHLLTFEEKLKQEEKQPREIVYWDSDDSMCEDTTDGWSEYMRYGSSSENDKDSKENKENKHNKNSNNNNNNIYNRNRNEQHQSTQQQRKKTSNNTSTVNVYKTLKYPKSAKLLSVWLI